MKLSKLFFGVAAAAMFAACSSDDIVATEQAPEWNADGTGYVAFSINNAQEVTASRSENDKYGNGEKSEYDVQDVTLVICNADGVVYEAFSMAPGFGGPNAEGTNVTADKFYVQKISAEVGNPYAFVIINNNGLFYVDGGKLMRKVGGTSTEVTNVKNLATTVQNGLNLNADAFTKKGILMMNAPLSNVMGETNNPKDANLSYFVAPLHVYTTEEAANAHADGVGEVYVERAVAKVELTGEDKNAGGLTWEIKGWTLDNTNKSSYLLHNVSNMDETMLAYNYNGTKHYRMVGYKSVKHDLPASLGTGTTNDRYRTYFGLDPNMGLAPAAQAAALNRVDYSALTFDNPKYQYCAENLFDVQHQDYGNTTRALIQVQLEVPSGKTLYSKPGDDKFYDETSVKNAAQQAAAKKIAESKLWPYIQLDAGKEVVKFTTTLMSDGTVKVVASDCHLDIDAAGATAAGFADVTAATTAYSELMTQSLTAKEFGFNYYAGGIAYYDVRIKHFGDYYCPWTLTDPNITTTAAAYETAYNADKYLGRWGVLRNNWYAVNITDVTKIGYADPSDLDLKPRDPSDPNNPDGPDPETPDDNTPGSEKWIAVDVNVLSWAKRLDNQTL